MISVGNRKVYATNSEQPAIKMLGLSKGKTATRIEIRQTALEVTNQNSIGFGRHSLPTKAPRQIISMTAPTNPTEVIVC